MKFLRVSSNSEFQESELAARFSQAPGGPITERYRCIADAKEVAFVVIDWWTDKPYAVLYELFVASTHRNKGVGSAVLAAVEHLVAQNDRFSVRLLPRALDTSQTDEQLEAWYEKRGYERMPTDANGMFSKKVHKSQLTPVNLWNQARDFLRSAEREFAVTRQSFVLPPYFLASRAIELSLKSFLLLRSADEAKLRKISHNLLLACSEASSAGLADMVDLDEQDLLIIEWINDYYQSKDLEYPKTGMKSFPPAPQLLACAKKLVDGVQPEIRRWRPTQPGLDGAES